METVYLVHRAIPELGAMPGDYLVVEPGHPRAPLQVVRNFDARALGHRAELLDSLPIVSGPAPDLSAYRRPHLELI